MFDWISVKDLLPSVGLKVLGWNGGSHIIVSLDENGCFYDENERVVVCTHWSHLLKGPDKNYDKKKKEIEALRTIELVKPWAKETLEAFKNTF